MSSSLAEELRRLLEAELDVEERDVAADRRAGEGGDHGVGEGGRDLAGADPVPLDLLSGRPAVGGERLLPGTAQLVPVAVAQRDPAEREELPLGELAGLVEEEQVHARISCGGERSRQLAFQPRLKERLARPATGLYSWRQTYVSLGK